MKMKNSSSLLIAIGLLQMSTAFAAPHGIYPTRQQKELFQALRSAGVLGSGTSLLYYGGPVLANVKIYSVMWGPEVDQATQSRIGDFFKVAVNSTYMDWLSEYNTGVKAVDGRQGTDQTIGRGSYVSQIVITPQNKATQLNDTDIQAELDQQINAGVLPKPDGNTLYMTYFPAGITITIDGQSSCSAFCAYHEGFVSKTNGNVFYGVMPDLGGTCSFGCGFQANAFDAMTEVTSHEMIEATTDPFPTPGNSPAYPQAWNTSDGNEIGDLCAGNSTKVTTASGNYVLQQEFDNATHSCAPGPYQSP